MDKMGIVEISKYSRVEKIKRIRMMLANKYQIKDIANIFILPEKTIRKMKEQPYCFMLADKLANSGIFPFGW